MSCCNSCCRRRGYLVPRIEVCLSIYFLTAAIIALVWYQHTVLAFLATSGICSPCSI